MQIECPTANTEYPISKKRATLSHTNSGANSPLALLEPFLVRLDIGYLVFFCVWPLFGQRLVPDTARSLINYTLAQYRRLVHMNA